MEEHEGVERRKEDSLWRETFVRQLEALTEHASEMDARIVENTKVTKAIADSTKELVDIMNSFRGAMSAMDIIGKFLKPFAFISSISLATITAWFTFKGK